MIDDERTRDNSQWVHEEDYGSPALGSIIGGLWAILVGLCQLTAYGIRRLFRR